MKELDLAAVSWVLVLTKSDKLKKDELTKVMDETQKVISKHPASFPEIMITSSLKNDGLVSLRTHLASFAQKIG